MAGRPSKYASFLGKCDLERNTSHRKGIYLPHPLLYGACLWPKRKGQSNHYKGGGGIVASLASPQRDDTAAKQRASLALTLERKARFALEKRARALLQRAVARHRSMAVQAGKTPYRRSEHASKRWHECQCWLAQNIPKLLAPWEFPDEELREVINFLAPADTKTSLGRNVAQGKWRHKRLGHRPWWMCYCKLARSLRKRARELAGLRAERAAAKPRFLTLAEVQAAHTDSNHRKTVDKCGCWMGRKFRKLQAEMLGAQHT